MDPRYMDNLEKNTFSLVLLQEKNCEMRGAFLTYWRLISLLSFEKELGLGERLVQHTCKLPFGAHSFASLQVIIFCKWRALKEPRAHSWLVAVESA